MRKETEYWLRDLLTGQTTFELLEQVIGEKVKRFMNKAIKYSDEPLGEIKLVTDFLPTPEGLALKNENT